MHLDSRLLGNDGEEEETSFPTGIRRMAKRPSPQGQGDWNLFPKCSFIPRERFPAPRDQSGTPFPQGHGEGDYFHIGNFAMWDAPPAAIDQGGTPFLGEKGKSTIRTTSYPPSSNRMDHPKSTEKTGPALSKKYTKLIPFAAPCARAG